MGMLNFFNKKNPVHKLERAVATETVKILTLKELGSLSFNPKNHITYIAAEICFAFATIPQFKNIPVKAEFQDFIDNEKNKETFIILFEGMNNYYKGIPDLNRAM